ncbi:hypothetical protein SAMN04488000_109275 [Lentzea albida]|uniref:Uncharacterized protein n=1 Tax=Lentzea albida TaxID=65499 RepID=A0A1H9PVA0_9PSEU|nr:hypothetical protein SAMN04488000_109275 [Lentzea albida]
MDGDTVSPSGIDPRLLLRCAAEQQKGPRSVLQGEPAAELTSGDRSSRTPVTTAAPPERSVPPSPC